MAVSGTLTWGFDGGGNSRSESKTYSGTARVTVVETVADSTTDGQIVIPAIDVSELKLVYINSDQAVTIETNSGATPDDTLTLVSNVPYFWSDDNYFTNLLTTDIGTNGVYVTNASGSTATIEFEFVLDATP